MRAFQLKKNQKTKNKKQKNRFGTPLISLQRAMDGRMEDEKGVTASL